MFAKLGNGTVRDLTLDTNTIYTHPATKQCNYSIDTSNFVTKNELSTNGSLQWANIGTLSFSGTFSESKYNTNILNIKAYLNTYNLFRIVPTAFTVTNVSKVDSDCPYLGVGLRHSTGYNHLAILWARTQRLQDGVTPTVGILSEKACIKYYSRYTKNVHDSIELEPMYGYEWSETESISASSVFFSLYCFDSQLATWSSNNWCVATVTFSATVQGTVF